MKRIFVRAGIALVGIITWLLPSQAEAQIYDWISCERLGFYWICDADEQCWSRIVFTSSGVYLVYGCV